MKLLVFIGLAIANYGYEFIFSDIPNFSAAFDCTYFQGSALMMAWLVEKHT